MSAFATHPPRILIIGAGVFGASAAYHLSTTSATSDCEIILIDRSPLDPLRPVRQPAASQNPAASSDINKILRADYTSLFYSNLAAEALTAWSEWPILRPFFHRTGWIALNEEGSDTTHRIREVFAQRGEDPTSDIPLNKLGKDEGNDDEDGVRWKFLSGTKLEGFDSAYWNPNAGWCDAAAATSSLAQAAIERGVKYVVGEVEGIIYGGDAVTAGGGIGVRCSDGSRYFASQLILAVGAWTSNLLSPVEEELRIPLEDRVERQVTAAGVAVVHYELSDAESSALRDMPVVVYGSHGEVIPPPNENRLLKYTNANTFTNYVVTSAGAQISVPASVQGHDQYDVPAQLQAEMRALMTDCVMPDFTRDSSPAYWRLCWDARTPTQDWLLCRYPHPKLDRVILATGGSFHSYKFLPTLGKYIVNVLNGAGNGRERDLAWGWKAKDAKWRGAHEKTEPKRDWSEFLEK